MQLGMKLDAGVGGVKWRQHDGFTAGQLPNKLPNLDLVFLKQNGQIWVLCPDKKVVTVGNDAGDK